MEKYQFSKETNLKDKKYFQIENGIWTGAEPPFKSIKILRNTNFDDYGYFDFGNVAEIEIEAKQFPRKAIRRNDILIERSGGGPNTPVGRVSLYDREDDVFSFSNFTSRLRIVSDEIDPEFIHIQLLHFHWNKHTEKIQTQTTNIRNLEFDKYTKLKLQLPKSKAEQKRIAAELKSKLNSVNQMRQAALKQKEAVEALQGALLREVFPYKEGEELPKGWKWEKIGKICKVQAGGTPSRADMSYWTNGTIPWLKTGEIVFNEINQPEEFITQSGLDNSSAKLIPPQCVLIALYGQGKTRGRVAINNFEVTTNQACAAIIPPKFLSTKYLFYYLWANYEILRDLSSGSNQDNLNADLVKTFSVPFPNDKSVQDGIVNIISEKMNSQIKLQQQTSTQLEAIEAMPAAILREVFDFNVRTQHAVSQ
ncbi:MAG: restriction endonuclease subunit S [Bacteroidia bacterium]|nr:restriction endonuclease subunit S [Bacteroidia bacterium]